MYYRPVRATVEQNLRYVPVQVRYSYQVGTFKLVMYLVVYRYPLRLPVPPCPHLQASDVGMLRLCPSVHDCHESTQGTPVPQFDGLMISFSRWYFQTAVVCHYKYTQIWVFWTDHCRQAQEVQYRRTQSCIFVRCCAGEELVRRYRVTRIFFVLFHQKPSGFLVADPHKARAVNFITYILARLEEIGCLYFFQFCLCYSIMKRNSSSATARVNHTKLFVAISMKIVGNVWFSSILIAYEPNVHHRLSVRSLIKTQVGGVGAVI